MFIEQIAQNPTILLSLILWELIWKGLALWKAGNRKQKWWFISIFILNTLGILPIVYLLLNKDKEK